MAFYSKLLKGLLATALFAGPFDIDNNDNDVEDDPSRSIAAESPIAIAEVGTVALFSVFVLLDAPMWRWSLYAGRRAEEGR